MPLKKLVKALLLWASNKSPLSKEVVLEIIGLGLIHSLYDAIYDAIKERGGSKSPLYKEPSSTLSESEAQEILGQWRVIYNEADDATKISIMALLRSREELSLKLLKETVNSHTNISPISKGQGFPYVGPTESDIKFLIKILNIPKYTAQIKELLDCQIKTRKAEVCQDFLKELQKVLEESTEPAGDSPEGVVGGGGGSGGGAPEAPDTEAPDTEAPGTEAPGTEAPGTEAPGTEAPDTEAPDTGALGETYTPGA